MVATLHILLLTIQFQCELLFCFLTACTLCTHPQSSIPDLASNELSAAKLLAAPHWTVIIIHMLILAPAVVRNPYYLPYG